MNAASMTIRACAGCEQRPDAVGPMELVRVRFTTGAVSVLEYCADCRCLMRMGVEAPGASFGASVLPDQFASLELLPSFEADALAEAARDGNRFALLVRLHARGARLWNAECRCSTMLASPGDRVVLYSAITTEHDARASYAHSFGEVLDCIDLDHVGFSL